MSYSKKIFITSLPICLSYLGMVLLMLTDTFMVSKLGNTALAASGLSGNIYVFYFLFSVGLFTGVESLLAYFRGAKDKRGITSSITHGLGLMGLLSLLGYCSLSLVVSKLNSLGVIPEIAYEVNNYFYYIKFALFPHFLFIAFRQILSHFEATKFSMSLVIFSLPVNYYLNQIFIFDLNMGIAGASLATLSIRLFMFLSLLVFALYLVFKNNLLSTGVIFDLPILKKSLQLGGPVAFQYIIRSGLFVCLGVWISTLSSEFMSAHIMFLTIGTLSYTIYGAYATSIGILVGNYFGGKDYNSMKKIVPIGVFQALFLTGIILLTYYQFNSFIFDQFNASLETRRMGPAILGVFVLFHIADTVQMILSNVLRAVGETRELFLYSLLVFCNSCVLFNDSFL